MVELTAQTIRRGIGGRPMSSCGLLHPDDDDGGRHSYVLSSKGYHSITFLTKKTGIKYVHGLYKYLYLRIILN